MSSECRDPTQYHMGHLFLESMKQRPDAICQIDGTTGEKETKASVLNRSIRLARSLRNAGLRPGDVLSLGGSNHLDLHIPFYAALLIGLPISGVDPMFKFDELKALFKLSRPKIAFCQTDTYGVYKEVLSDLGLDTKVVTFGEGDSSMKNFIETHDSNELLPDCVIPVQFDLDKVYAFLISTSGTSGKMKLAAITHGNMISKINMYTKMTTTDDSGANQISLNLSPINWITGFYNAIGPLVMGHTKLQTSNPDNFDHIIDIINKYKPVNTLISVSLISSLINRKEDVDLTCFRLLTFTGTKIYPDMKRQFRTLLHKDAIFMESYGMTETLGPCLAPNVGGPEESCGRRLPTYRVKLVDPNTGKEITEPNTAGEFLVKGIIFTEYYNDPKETFTALSEDGYYKTGDLLYFDENENFYFVDRLKSLIKFRNYHILPAELEEVIRTHPAVLDICVCGVPDPHDGQRPVACVVKHKECSVTAQNIKDLVANKLSRNKELSGGVVFLDELPMTSTGKVVRAKLLDIVLKLPRE